MFRARKKNLAKILLHVVAYSLAFVIIFPVVWMMVSSVKPSSDIFASPPILIPSKITFEHYARASLIVNVPLYLKNSFTLAIATTSISISLVWPAAYVLTRYRFKGKARIMQIILITYSLPPIFLAIPLLSIFAALGISNSFLGLTLGHVTFTLPFSIWVLWQFFKAIPIELEEAALVDGANRLQAVWYVFLPLALPGIVSICVFSFLMSWNNYVYAYILTSGEALKTLPLGLASLMGEEVQWGPVYATATFMSLPPLIGFAVIQKYLLEGFKVGVVEE